MPAGPAAQLRKLMAQPGILVAAAVYDCLTARLAEQAGLKLAFTSGFGMSATMIGRPDFGLLTASEVLHQLRNICGAVQFPVIADMDTGYGNALNVMRTVEQAVRAGAAGVILEDQQWPKKCGHFEGKQVISTGEHVSKIKAALRASTGSNLVIVARTDARATHGLEEAIARGRAYAEAGADVVFVEAPQSEDELQLICSRLKHVALFANIVEGGKTPALSAGQLERLGFKFCAFALSGLYAATMAVRDCFRQIRQQGSTAGRFDSFSFGEFAEVIGLERFRQLEAEFAPSTITAGAHGSQPRTDPNA